MAFLSDQSRINIERALHRAAKSYLLRDPADSWAIAASREPLASTTAGEKIILVTLSSFKFRLLVIFHVDEGPTLASYFVGRETKRSVEEAFYEIANMCCGALNRDITQDFRHLAMSVPYTLAATCMSYIPDLRPEYLSSSTVTINDNIQVRLTLCMCCSAPVSFSATGAASQSESDSGTLELF
jgi:predicted lipase